MSKSMSYFCPYCYENSDTFIEMNVKGWKRRATGEVKNYICPSCHRRTVSPLNQHGSTIGPVYREMKPIESGHVYFYDDPESPNIKDIVAEDLNRPLTVDELLDACKINRDVWMVADEPEIRYWDTAMKLQEKNSEGNVESYPHKIRNWRLSVRLVYRNPKPVLPEIKPVSINVSLPTGKRTEDSCGNRIKTALIAGDAHIGFNVENDKGHLTYIPFHDRSCMDIFLQVAENEKPDYIVFGGDQLDNTNLSRFKKYPQYSCLQAAIMEYSWWLAKLRSICPQSEIVEIRGNHDSRLEQAIVTHNLDAYKLNTVNSEEYIHDISHWLGFEDLGIAYKNSLWLRDDWKIEHGSFGSSKPGATCSKHLTHNNINVTFFHTHSKEYAEQTTEQRYGKHIIKAYSPGCMCRVDGSIPGTENQNRNWQNGFSVVEFTEDEEYPIQVDQVDVKEGKTVYNKNIFEYRDSYLEELRKETEWNF